MRAYKQRTGAVVAVVFGLLAAVPPAPKACGAMKSCASKKMTATAEQKEKKEKDEKPMEEKPALPSAESEPAEEAAAPSETKPSDEPAQDAPEQLAAVAPEPAFEFAGAGEKPKDEAPRYLQGRVETWAPRAQVRAATPVRVPAKAAESMPTPMPGERLQIANARDITPAQAETMLRQTGYVSKDRNMTQALSAMETGYNEGAPTRGVLDATSREHLLLDYQHYWTARQKYRQHPTISMKQTPELVRAFVKDGASHMKNIPPGQREALLLAAIEQESSLVHWENFRPTVSRYGGIGFGQPLTSKARSFGYNPYDPRANVICMARALDTAYPAEGNSIYNALGRYNGGPSWRSKGESTTYAASITQRMRRRVAG